MLKQFQNPKTIFQDLKDIYLSEGDIKRNVKDWIQKALASDVDPRVEDPDKWNEVVSYLATRLLLPGCGRPGNVANMTRLNLLEAKVMTGLNQYAISVRKHKVGRKYVLKLFVSTCDMDTLYCPYGMLRARFSSNQNDPLFVTASGNPVRKSSFLYRRYNRSAKKNKKITANVLRHLCVSLQRRGRLGISDKVIASVLLHSERTASDFYHDVSTEELFINASVFSNAIFNETTCADVARGQSIWNNL